MCAVFGDAKAAVCAHQEAREFPTTFIAAAVRATLPLQGHSSTSRCSTGLSLLPAVTDTQCISRKESDVGPDAASMLVSSEWEEGSSGGEEGSSLRLLPLPGWG